MSGVVEAALRGLSYLFHLALAALLLGLSAAFFLSPESSFGVGILPWQGETLAWILMVWGLVAVAAVYLAVRRITPVLLLLWSVAALVALAYWCFLSRYYFGRDGPTLALLLLLGAAVATLGSWMAVRRGSRPARPFIDDRSAAD